MKILFIGLGVIGGPMAGHLVNAGFDVVGYNRSQAKAQAWLDKNSKASIASLEEAIPEADVIISCVGNDNDLAQLCDSDSGILNLAKPKIIWIDHTTSSATIAKTLHQKLKSKNIAFYDAPVSGGAEGAINGKLTVMLGGDLEHIDKITTLMNAYAARITHVGESGSGQLTKMVNQICLANVLQGLSEGLAFSKKSGLDVDKVIKAISKGAAQSWQMENRAHTMIKDEFDFGFAIDLMRKDLGICFDEAEKLATKLPATSFIDNEYKKLQQDGHGTKDTSILIKQFD